MLEDLKEVILNLEKLLNMMIQNEEVTQSINQVTQMLKILKNPTVRAGNGIKINGWRRKRLPGLQAAL